MRRPLEKLTLATFQKTEKNAFKVFKIKNTLATLLLVSQKNFLYETCCKFTDL